MNKNSDVRQSSLPPSTRTSAHGSATVPTRLAFAAGVYGIVLGALLTDRERWPPGGRSRVYRCHWTFVAVAVLDWHAWGLAPSLRLAGVPLAVVGTALFPWGVRTMRSAETMGVTGDRHTGGPYAYTRNPQYCGMIVGVAGVALLVGSALLAALAAVHVGWVLLLPCAEEPHPRAEFGEAYDRYAARVPRFVGLHTLRRVAAAVRSSRLP